MRRANLERLRKSDRRLAVSIDDDLSNIDQSLEYSFDFAAAKDRIGDPQVIRNLIALRNSLPQEVVEVNFQQLLDNKDTRKDALVLLRFVIRMDPMKQVHLFERLMDKPSSEEMIDVVKCVNAFIKHIPYEIPVAKTLRFLCGIDDPEIVPYTSRGIRLIIEANPPGTYSFVSRLDISRLLVRTVMEFTNADSIASIRILLENHVAVNLEGVDVNRLLQNNNYKTRIETLLLINYICEETNYLQITGQLLAKIMMLIRNSPYREFQLASILLCNMVLRSSLESLEFQINEIVETIVYIASKGDETLAKPCTMALQYLNNDYSNIIEYLGVEM